MYERIELVAAQAERRMRLEDFLCSRFRHLSKMYLREIVRDGLCEVNGRLENIGYRLRTNDFVEIEVDLTRETAMRPQEIPIDVVYEDTHLIVVNKPAGMLVHPTHRDRSGTLLNALAFYLNKSKEIKGSAAIRPGLVHRLDKQTSGLIVIAKDLQTHRLLTKRFQRREVEKRYLALVDGRVRDDEGTIDRPIGRFAELKHWSVKEDGKHSITRFRVKERTAEATLLELEPVTGRTNQLRIHCASIGHPIIGDVSRGGKEFARLCLHAHIFAFAHPSDGRLMEFEAALPREIDKLLSVFS